MNPYNDFYVHGLFDQTVVVLYQGTRLPVYPRVPGHFSATRNRLLRSSCYPEPTRTRVHYPEGTRRVTERLKGSYFSKKYRLF